jgi:hypothetical protein
MKVEEPKELTLSRWYRTGNGMMYNREALDPSHPESWYQQVKAQGLTPEDYGLYRFSKDMYEKYKTMTNEQLISIIADKNSQIEELHWYLG